MRGEVRRAGGSDRGRIIEREVEGNPHAKRIHTETHTAEVRLCAF